MLCDHTFRCPRRLFTSLMGSWLKCPLLQDMTSLSLFQLPDVYKRGKFIKIISITLLLPWQHLSKTCLHLYLCCRFWMFHTQTSRGSSWRARKCTVDFPRKSSHLSRRARKCTVDFHLQVKSPLKTFLQVHLWLSLTSHLIPFGIARHCGRFLSSWCSHPALASLILLSGTTKSCCTGHPLWARFALCGVVVLLLRAWHCYLVPHILLRRTPTVGLVLLVGQYMLRYCHTSYGTG